MLRICCTKQLGVIKALHIKGNPIKPGILFGKRHSTSHSEWKLPRIQPQSWAAEQKQSTQLSDKVMREKMVQHERSAATLTLTVWMVKIDPAAWRFWFTEFVTESQTNMLWTLRLVWNSTGSVQAAETSQTCSQRVQKVKGSLCWCLQDLLDYLPEPNISYDHQNICLLLQSSNSFSVGFHWL